MVDGCTNNGVLINDWIDSETCRHEIIAWCSALLMNVSDRRTTNERNQPRHTPSNE